MEMVGVTRLQKMMIQKTRLQQVIALFLLLCMCCALGGCTPVSAAPKDVDPSLDICHKCKMSVIAPLFAGQILDERGQSLMFDDIGCMISYIKSDKNAEKNAKALYVMGFDTKEWLEADKSFFVKGTLDTPMKSGIVAASSTTEAQRLADNMEGKVFSWEEIKSALESKPVHEGM